MGFSGHSHIIARMMGTEMVRETSVIFKQLALLIAREMLLILVALKALHHVTENRLKAAETKMKCVTMKLVTI
jgi:hypothetical protein